MIERKDASAMLTNYLAFAPCRRRKLRSAARHRRPGDRCRDLRGVDSENVACGVTCGEKALSFSVFESVDVENIARRIEVPGHDARAVAIIS